MTKWKVYALDTVVFFTLPFLVILHCLLYLLEVYYARKARMTRPEWRIYLEDIDNENEKWHERMISETTWDQIMSSGRNDQ